MDKFDLVRKKFNDVPSMKHENAVVLRDIIRDNDVTDVLEIGFFKGKSTAYIAATLEDRGNGSVTTFDRRSAMKHEPNVDVMVKECGLDHRVTPILCKRSYTWELQKLINAEMRPQFDMCYFDGGHTWDATGFGVVLVDMLLKPGGLLVLSDLDWSIQRSPYYKKNPKMVSDYSVDERESKSVRLVWDTILPHLGYSHVEEYKAQRWGVARKGE